MASRLALPRWARYACAVLLLAEPTTLATDYALALLCSACSWRLRSLRRPSAARVFAALALAALAGGTFHGWRATLGFAGQLVLWGVTCVAMGAASAWLLLAYPPERLRQRWLGRLRALALAKLVLLLAACALDPGIRWVLADYALSLLIVVGLHARDAQRTLASLWLYAAASISLAGAALQRAHAAAVGVLNHNDLFHLVAMLGAACLYAAARSLPEA